MAFAPFVPLRIFSAYTMLEGAIEPKAIAKRARELGFPAAAICDRNGLYAAPQFSEACRESGVQPIIGTLISVSRPDRPDAVPPAYDWLALYAQDMRGYENLCALVSMAHLDRPLEEEPHVTFDQLLAHNEGVLCLTGGGEGALCRFFAEGQPAAALAYADHLVQTFPNRTYVEVSRRFDEI